MTPGQGELEEGPPDIGGSFPVPSPRPLPASGATCEPRSGGTGESVPRGGGGSGDTGTFPRPHPVSRELGEHPGTRNPRGRPSPGAEPRRCRGPAPPGPGGDKGRVTSGSISGRGQCPGRGGTAPPAAPPGLCPGSPNRPGRGAPEGGAGAGGLRPPRPLHAGPVPRGGTERSAGGTERAAGAGGQRCHRGGTPGPGRGWR